MFSRHATSSGSAEQLTRGRENNPTVTETIPRSSRTEHAPPQNLSPSSYLALIRVPSGPTLSPNVCKGGISDGCFQNIIELLAKRLVDTGTSPLRKADPFFSDISRLLTRIALLSRVPTCPSQPFLVDTSQFPTLPHPIISASVTSGFCKAIHLSSKQSHPSVSALCLPHRENMLQMLRLMPYNCLT